MFRSPLSFLAVASLLFASCRPEPLEIKVQQATGTTALSSICLDGESVYLSASYTLSSLRDVHDTTAADDGSGIPRDLLVDSATVTLSAPGQPIETLRMIRPGLFGCNDLRLVPGVNYTLTLTDLRKRTITTSTTTYIPRPQVDTIYPERIITGGDTVVRLHIRIRNAGAGSHFFASYRSLREVRQSAGSILLTAAGLRNFRTRQIELFNANALNNGTIDKVITLAEIAPNDSLLVQLGQVDRPYYNYLDAYKRSGALLNQLTGEPINLPTNVKTGYGYFALYEPVRHMWDLNAH